MSWNQDWKKYLKDLAKDGIDFGHNCWDSADSIRKFSKLERMGAQIFIKTEDYCPDPYRIKVYLPSSFSIIQTDKQGWQVAQDDADVLLYILTKLPAASSVKLKKDREDEQIIKYLDMEWHW